MIILWVLLQTSQDVSLTGLELTIQTKETRLASSSQASTCGGGIKGVYHHIPLWLVCVCKCGVCVCVSTQFQYMSHTALEPIVLLHSSVGLLVYATSFGLSFHYYRIQSSSSALLLIFFGSYLRNLYLYPSHEFFSRLGGTQQY